MTRRQGRSFAIEYTRLHTSPRSSRGSLDTLMSDPSALSDALLNIDTRYYRYCTNMGGDVRTSSLTSKSKFKRAAAQFLSDALLKSE